MHQRILGHDKALKHFGFQHGTPFDRNAVGICLTKMFPGRLHSAYTSQIAIQKLIHLLAGFNGRAVQWEKCRTGCSRMPTSSSTKHGYLKLSVGLHGERREDANMRHLNAAWSVMMHE